jgi:Leucine-rich repeat (LRR) protein
MNNLKRLDLFRNKITSKGIEALIRSKNLPNLEYLDLTANAVNPEEIAFLEKMSELPSIKVLIIQ